MGEAREIYIESCQGAFFPPGNQTALERLKQAADLWRAAGQHFSAGMAMSAAVHAAWGRPDKMAEVENAALQDFQHAVLDSPPMSPAALAALQRLRRELGQALWLFETDKRTVKAKIRSLGEELAQRLITHFADSDQAESYLVRGIRVTTDLDGTWQVDFPSYEVDSTVESFGRQVAIAIPSAFHLFVSEEDWPGAHEVAERHPDAFTSHSLKGWWAVVLANVEPSQAVEFLDEAADAFELDTSPTPDELSARGGSWSGINVQLWAKYFRARARVYEAIGKPGEAKLLINKAVQSLSTSKLGGHLDRCSRCGHRAISYNSCRNRHGPKCLTRARDQWLAERRRELLPVGYFPGVFTIPHELSWLALQNKKVVYDLLFRTSAATLLEVAADAKHLGAQIGFLSVLHTWGQNLLHHPHVHCVIPVGGLSLDGQHWVRSRYAFFLPVKVLSRVFRGKFVAGLKRTFRDGKLSFPGSIRHLADDKAFRSFLRSLFRHDWVVYAKRPFGGPEHVLPYLARYTHRVAISNHRIVNLADGKVTFRWKDYAHGSKQRKMAVSGQEFLRRFLLHVLPRGFVRIRFFGFLANRCRTQLLPLCQRLLEVISQQRLPALQAGESKLPASWLCPHCGGAMVLIEKFTAEEIRWKSAEASPFLDSS